MPRDRDEDVPEFRQYALNRNGVWPWYENDTRAEAFIRLAETIADYLDALREDDRQRSRD